MAHTPNLTRAAPARQQMDRSNDPEEARAMEAAAPAAAMASRRQRYAGSATGVGSVGFRESGAFDVGAGGGAVEPSPGPAARRDPGHAAGDIGPDGTPGHDPLTGPGLGAAPLRRNPDDQL